MEVAVVKYNAGNVFSVINALSRLGVKAVLTDDAEVIQNASHVVFPGQGEAAGAIRGSIKLFWACGSLYLESV